jgi:hypothetical protein
MSHEDLIATLASQATPVKPLPAPHVRMARWLLLAALAIGIAIAWRGLRLNWPTAFSDPTFLVTVVLLLVVALTSAWAAFMLAVPGALRSPVAKWLPIAGLGAWGALLIQQMVSSGAVVATLMSEPAVTGCMWKTYGIALGPALVILLLAQRAAPLDWRWTGSLAALSALAFGVLGTELICPITHTAHLFNWHFMPVAVMTLVAFLVGGLSARR